MGKDTDRMRDDIEARRKEILRTTMEIGDRVAVPRTTFIAGMFTGIFMLAMLNRIQFRRARK